MNDRITAETRSADAPHRQRRVAALVAQYIHELSDRHARSRDGRGPGGAAPPPAGAGAEPATESQGG